MAEQTGLSGQLLLSTLQDLKQGMLRCEARIADMDEKLDGGFAEMRTKNAEQDKAIVDLQTWKAVVRAVIIVLAVLLGPGSFLGLLSAALKGIGS